MSVEIKELVIRAVTTLDPNDGKKQAMAQSPAEEKEAIIQECIRQILRILKKREER